MNFEIPEFLIDGPKRKYRATLILAHGAGAPMDSDFMNVIANGLADRKFRVIRFEFPYMAERRKTGKAPPPNRLPLLVAVWKKVISHHTKGKVFVGGKSMGGRIASMVADEMDVSGVICLGYPFHPIGKPDVLRTQHLEKIKTPMLVVQGERDPFGNKTETPYYNLNRKIKFTWLMDGDHSFKPRKISGVTLDENLEFAIDAVEKFMIRLI